MVAIVAKRWPIDLLPSQCKWGMSHNDQLFVSPDSRRESVIRRGRPLWTASVTWERFEGEINRLYDILHGIGGFRGSVILWDFLKPKPRGLGLVANESTSTADNPLLTWTNSGSKNYWISGGYKSRFSYVSGATTLTTNQVAGTLDVPITGLYPSSTILLAGDKIQIGRRLYVVRAPLVSNGSGAGTAYLHYGLVQNTPAGSEVRVRYAGCEMRLKDQDWEFSGQANDPTRPITLNFIETGVDY